MIDFLVKLTSRKLTRTAEKATAWQRLVLRAESVTEHNVDSFLDELDLLGRSVSELDEAVALLLQRRQWATTVAAGDDAEAELEKTRTQIEEEESKFAKLHSAHESKMDALLERRNEAVFKLARGDDARRDLRRTAGGDSRSRAVAAIDIRLSELQAEQQAVTSQLKSCERWISCVVTHGDSAANGDRKRLPEMMDRRRGLLTDCKAFGGKFADLQAERDEAERALLAPEAI